MAPRKCNDVYEDDNKENVSPRKDEVFIKADNETQPALDPLPGPSKRGRKSRLDKHQEEIAMKKAKAVMECCEGIHLLQP